MQPYYDLHGCCARYCWRSFDCSAVAVVVVAAAVAAAERPLQLELGHVDEHQDDVAVDDALGPGGAMTVLLEGIDAGVRRRAEKAAFRSRWRFYLVSEGMANRSWSLQLLSGEMSQMTAQRPHSRGVW